MTERYSTVRLNTIEAYEEDITSQVACLRRFVLQKPLSTRARRRAIFCGSGDSLAACMLAEAFSGYTVRAADPLDLLKNPTILAGAHLYAVSVSGRTTSNIRAARIAKHATAITSDPYGKLAATCSKTIPLRFPNSDAVTAGSLSFLESALTCISLVHQFKMPSVRPIFERAQERAAHTRLQKRIFFLGNMHTYPLAMYAAAKFYEILGAQAYYERLEQFSHMELFSCGKGDTIVIMEESNAHNRRLESSLKKIGLNVVRLDPGSRDKVRQFLFFVFYAQLAPLQIAKSAGLTECSFVSSKNIRTASDEMIY